MKSRIALSLAALLTASPAFAHLDPAGHGSFAAGASHPVFGPDHILAMVAVGLWAVVQARRTGETRALWLLPTAFVGMMTVGFLSAMRGVDLPLVEPMILASVMVLGGMAALALRMPLAGAAAITGLFALFHGHAHGAEIGAAEALPYLAGFALSTALLHAAGVAGGLTLTQRSAALPRVLGACVVLAGTALGLAG
ncbi:HupE/UreJ family protein [Epibacterium sp. DP7N7-1]|uniref:HupE/UreJ family protein n=1 Tax=Tritonibacter mobilis TaxID=379347 RepID=UPI001C57F801|nr:HupE/UreJ family protein [Tritonibacter mobilis]MBW3244142.1 HupE/UreJ family protein [Epibacterium sp. DP7N7-1]MCA2007705.1 HupE/UreJ family protein [Tritonibacter mobilis]